MLASCPMEMKQSRVNMFVSRCMLLGSLACSTGMASVTPHTFLQLAEELVASFASATILEARGTSVLDLTCLLFCILPCAATPTNWERTSSIVRQQKPDVLLMLHTQSQQPLCKMLVPLSGQ